MAYLKKEFEKVAHVSYDTLFGRPLRARATEKREDTIQKINDKILPVITKEFFNTNEDEIQSKITQVTPILLNIIDILSKRPYSKPNDEFVTVVKKNTVDNENFQKHLSHIADSGSYDKKITDGIKKLNGELRKYLFLEEPTDKENAIDDTKKSKLDLKSMIDNMKTSTNLKLAVACFLNMLITILLERENNYKKDLIKEMEEYEKRSQIKPLNRLIGRLKINHNLEEDKKEVTFFYIDPHSISETNLWYGDGEKYVMYGITLLFPNLECYSHPIYKNKEEITEKYRNDVKKYLGQIFLNEKNWKILNSPNQIKLKQNNILSSLDTYCDDIVRQTIRERKPAEKAPETAAPLPGPIELLLQDKTSTPKKGVPSHKPSSVQKVTKHVSEAGTQAKKTLRGVGNEVQETLREVGGDVKYTTEKTVDAGKRAISKLGDAATKAGGALKDFLGRFRKGKK